jgi:hypothetical protein
MGIVIGFSTSENFISKAIRWFSRSEVSHAWISFDCAELGLKLIMHATSGGYKLNQWKRWHKGNKIVAQFVCSEDLSDGLLKMAKQLDRDYDYLSVIMLMPRRWLGKLFRNPIHNWKKLHCSEAVVRLLQVHGFAKHLDPESTTPGDLLEFCRNNALFEEV